MLVVENTKENRALQQVVATMAVEGMYLDEDFIEEMIRVSKGEKNYGEINRGSKTRIYPAKKLRRAGGSITPG